MVDAASSVESTDGALAPADTAWHEVGRVVGAWGVKGWLKVQPHAANPQALLAARAWRLGPSETAAASEALDLSIVQARLHGAVVVAQAHGIVDRSAAEALRGRRVEVARSAFPTPLADEYYWVDLIGLEVVNRAGTALGRVAGLVDTGPHAVLRLAPLTADAAERLIPFVSAYVDDVDLAARTIRVDWELDY